MLERLLPLTLTGTIALALVLAAEALFPNIWSCRWRYYIRLISVFTFLMPIVRPVIMLPPIYESPVFLEQPIEILNAVNDTLAVSPSTPSILPKVLFAVWLAGMLAFALCRLAAWLRFCAAVRRKSVSADEPARAVLEQCLFVLGVKRRVRLLVCPGIGAPALAGLLRPVILLPHSDLPEEELRLILHHELTHLHRWDIAYKLAVQLICALHWFNPFAWLLARQVNALCELSCDEAVVRGWDNTQRRRYGNAILDQIAYTRQFLPSGVPGFSAAKQILLQRMIVIMKIRKPNKKYAIAASITTLALCATCTITAFALAPTTISSAIVVIPYPAQADARDPSLQLKPVTVAFSAGGASSQSDSERLLPDSNAAKPTDSDNLPSVSSSSKKAVSVASSSKAPDSDRLLPDKKIAVSKEQPGIFTTEDDVTITIHGDSIPVSENVTIQLKMPSLTSPIVDIGNKKRISVGFKGYKGHTGMDFAMPEGTEIVAAADGVVSQVKVAGIPGNAYGNYLIISHGGGIRTLYAHCKELLVAEGEQVKQGQVIATVGKTGRTTGPQLHFELIENGTPIDPEEYIEFSVK